MTKPPTKKAEPKPSEKSSVHRLPRKTAGRGKAEAPPYEAAETAAPSKRAKPDPLNSPDGASDLAEATGWQPHSVYGAVPSVLKQKGLTIVSEVTGVRGYRVGVPQ